MLDNRPRGGQGEYTRHFITQGGLARQVGTARTCELIISGREGDTGRGRGWAGSQYRDDPEGEIKWGGRGGAKGAIRADPARI